MKRQIIGLCVAVGAITAMAGQWRYDNGTITDDDWVLSATLEESGVSVKGIQKIGVGSVIDLQHVEGLPCPICAIGDWAFYDGRGTIKSVLLPMTLASIGESAFRDCTSLSHVAPFLPSSLVSIGQRAFRCCPVEDDLLLACPQLNVIPDYIAWEGVFQGLKSRVVDMRGSGITYIGTLAFTECELLETVYMPESVATIGGYSFWNCPCLKHVEPFLPSSVEEIGEMAFYQAPIEDDLILSCPNLTRLPDADVWRGVFGEMKIKSVDMRKSGIKYIGSSAFNDMPSLETVYMPEGIETLSDYVFINCNGLKHIYWQTSKTLSVGVDSFCYVPELTFIQHVPRNDAFWTKYLLEKCSLVTPLSESEKSAFSEKFPSDKPAKGKVALPSGTRYQYYQTWTPKPVGTMVLCI